MLVTKRFIPVAALVLMSFGGTMMLRLPQMAAVAQPASQSAPPSSPSSPSKKPVPRFTNPVESKVFEQLNLTDDQTQKIEGINSNYRSQMEPLLQSRQQVAQEYQQMLDSDTATDAQIREKHRQMQGITQQISNASFERQVALRKVLTPEQRKQRSAIMNDPAKLREILQQISSDRGQRMTPSMMSPKP
jgi:Spy/CpxP family protein refolding chaperone